MTRHDHTPTSDLTRPGIDADPSARTAGSAVATIEASGPLANVRRTETIADRVNFDAVRRELPDEWEVRPDLVQFGSEPLAETVQFRRELADSRLVLKPTDPDEPAGEIEFYERGGPRASRRPTMTVEPLAEALRVAVNRVHQLE
jgi:hypothetical protein